jgi:hypothetical protein
LDFVAELFEKIGQRQARLKLDAVHGHGVVLNECCALIIRPPYEEYPT